MPSPWIRRGGTRGGMFETVPIDIDMTKARAKPKRSDVRNQDSRPRYEPSCLIFSRNATLQLSCFGVMAGKTTHRLSGEASPFITVAGYTPSMSFHLAHQPCSYRRVHSSRDREVLCLRLSNLRYRSSRSAIAAEVLVNTVGEGSHRLHEEGDSTTIVLVTTPTNLR